MEFGSGQFAAIAGALAFLALIAFVRVTLAKKGASKREALRAKGPKKAATATIVKRTRPRREGPKTPFIVDVAEEEAQEEREEPSTEASVEISRPVKARRKAKAASGVKPGEDGNGASMGDLVEFAERAGFDVPISINPEIKAVARASPRAAIPLAWAPVENELEDAVHRLKLAAKGEETDAFENIKRMSDAGALNPTAISLLHKMRQLRNSAAHDNQPRMALTTEDAISYSRLARWLEQEIGGSEAK